MNIEPAGIQSDHEDEGESAEDEEGRSWWGRLFARIDREWNNAGVATHALGKYIVAFASMLHYSWAVLLVVDRSASAPTAIHTLDVICGGRYRAAFTLCVVATSAIVYPFLRRRASARLMAVMLIPQQAVLLMSAFSGIFATAVQHYADGVLRPWPFILADQAPVILAALLYTAMVLEAARR